MKYTATLAGMALLFGASQADASLIFTGPDSLSGQGLGSSNTVETLTSPGASSTESGCVAAGIGGVTVTGATACPGAGPHGLSAFTGGDEQAINEAHAASALGLTDFADLRIIFNASEPGSNSISLDNLSLTLWDPANGLILDAYYIEDVINFASTDPGVGNAGFFFRLDAAQAAQANLIFASFPSLYLGLAANLSDATGGLETFSFGVSRSTSVPAPVTLALFGAGLAVLGLVTRRRAS